MNITKLITATATVAVAALTFACDTAQAEELPTIDISTTGVDLLNPSAVKMIEKRVRSAAIKVCQTPEQSEKGPMVYDRQCFVKARDNALARLQTQIASAATRRNGTTVVLASPAH